MPAAELDLAMSFYVALRRLDLVAMFDLLDPDVRLRHPEALPWGGDEHGYAGVRRFLERLVLHVDARFDVTDVLDGADTVTAGLFHGRVRDTDVPFGVRFVHIWRAANGRLIGLDAHLDTEELQRALGDRTRRPTGLTAPARPGGAGAADAPLAGQYSHVGPGGRSAAARMQAARRLAFAPR